MVNRQLRVYGYSGDAEFGSHQNNSVILGAPRVLLKTLDGTLKVNTEADLYVAVGPKSSLNWHDGRLLQSLPTSYVPLRTLYIGLNRALDGPWAPGSGLCAVNVTMMEKEGLQHNFGINTIVLIKYTIFVIYFLSADSKLFK